MHMSNCCYVLHFIYCTSSEIASSRASRGSMLIEVPHHVMSKLERHSRNLAGGPQPFPTPIHNPQTEPTPRNRIQPSQWHSRGKPPVSRTSPKLPGPPEPAIDSLDSYNRYIAVASRVVRRSLKEDKRIIAERRGVSELRFAKWEVS
jgi:hypothetical protein